MKSYNIIIGGEYIARVGGKLRHVKVYSKCNEKYCAVIKYTECKETPFGRTVSLQLGDFKEVYSVFVRRKEAKKDKKRRVAKKTTPPVKREPAGLVDPAELLSKFSF